MGFEVDCVGFGEFGSTWGTSGLVSLFGVLGSGEEFGFVRVEGFGGTGFVGFEIGDAGDKGPGGVFICRFAS